MPKIRFAGLALALLLVTAATPSLAGEHRLGLGVHYWRAVSDLADDGFDIDRDGLETNYISATLGVYLSIYNVFQSLLALFGIAGGRDE